MASPYMNKKILYNVLLKNDYFFTKIRCARPAHRSKYNRHKTTKNKHKKIIFHSAKKVHLFFFIPQKKVHLTNVKSSFIFFCFRKNNSVFYFYFFFARRKNSLGKSKKVQFRFFSKNFRCVKTPLKIAQNSRF